MLRLNPAQLLLLESNVAVASGNKTADKKAPSLHVKKKKQDLPENMVTRQITDFLRVNGWTLARQHVGTFIPYREYRLFMEDPGYKVHLLKIGEDGMTDWRAERPIIPMGIRPGDARSCEVFYLEFKGLGKKPTPDQRMWIERKRATGIPSNWFDSLDGFLYWYWRRYGVSAGDPPKVVRERS